MKIKSPFVEVAKKVCPAVITITITKNLPKIEGFYLFPFYGEEFIFPKFKKKKKEQKLEGDQDLLSLKMDTF
jgi:hypothetical protein